MAELLRQLKDELNATTSEAEQTQPVQLDNVDPGGRYLANGIVFDANGEVLGKEGEHVEGPLESTPVQSELIETHRINQDERQTEVQRPSEDYDTLTVAQVKQQIDSGALNEAEVIAYESVNKKRSSILEG